MADESRTEQATPRRRQRARTEGDVPRSRELSSALALMTSVLFLWWYPHNLRNESRGILEGALAYASRNDIQSGISLLNWTLWKSLGWTGPVLALIWVVALGGSMASGGFVFAPGALTPKFQRLNPANNLGKLFSMSGLQSLSKSLLPSGFILYLAIAMMTRDWTQILQMSQASVPWAFNWMFSRFFELSWKASLVFVLWSGFDVLMSHFNFERQLRMTRQEVREDFKEAEGHPAIRARVRRLQREMRRRRMLRDVARATVVVTNPNEYAVALEFKPGTMAAPVIVAKGRELLAQKIKREARWHGIPIVENPPLAQALYRAAEIGQAIPAKLYTAVAEILAFIFRAQRLAANAPFARDGQQSPH